MGAYIINRDGINGAIERGSHGNIVYRTSSMVKGKGQTAHTIERQAVNAIPQREREENKCTR